MASFSAVFQNNLEIQDATSPTREEACSRRLRHVCRRAFDGGFRHASSKTKSFFSRASKNGVKWCKSC